MRKRSGTIFMATVLSAVSLAATPIIAHAQHVVPGSGIFCNNPYFKIIHTGVAHSYQIGAHLLSNGQYCTITRLGLYHQNICTSCGAILKDNYTMECGVHHSLCGDTKIDSH